MFKILKGGNCYSPAHIGKKNIMVVGDRICEISDKEIEIIRPELRVFDCEGKIVCPGFIDQHVHITGGGGEEGPSSRIPELDFSRIVSSGITTLVGVLGLDCETRNTAGLLAKARSLEIEGITTFIYTGGYGIPVKTLTGRVISDLAFIDKIIGVGEIAISDFRSSHPSVQMLMDLSYDAKAGGMIGSKAGVVHIHVGDGKDGLGLLFKLLDESDFPIEMFVPTHINRNKALFNQGRELLQMGGNIDLTAGEESGMGYTVMDALDLLVKDNANISKVSVSSDGNGSMPSSYGGNGICRIEKLFEDVRNCFVQKKLDITTVLGCVTENVAKLLKIYPKKGTLMEGSDADLLVLNKDYTLDMVFARGELVVENGKPMRKGKYEK